MLAGGFVDSGQPPRRAAQRGPAAVEPSAEPGLSRANPTRGTRPTQPETAQLRPKPGRAAQAKTKLASQNRTRTATLDPRGPKPARPKPEPRRKPSRDEPGLRHASPACDARPAWPKTRASRPKPQPRHKPGLDAKPRQAAPSRAEPRQIARVAPNRAAARKSEPGKIFRRKIFSASYFPAKSGPARGPDFAGENKKPKRFSAEKSFRLLIFRRNPFLFFAAKSGPRAGPRRPGFRRPK